MSPPELRDLLAGSLAVWGIAARTIVANEGVTVTTPTDAIHITAASPEDLPIRWWLEKPGQRRPCTSILGLLRALRNAVGAGDGIFSRLRAARPEA
jgi:hypothetical protein